MKKYVCDVCGYVYDPEVGDPDNGIEPGTAFEDLPDDWVCPVLRCRQRSVQRGVTQHENIKGLPQYDKGCLLHYKTYSLSAKRIGFYFTRTFKFSSKYSAPAYDTGKNRSVPLTDMNKQHISVMERLSAVSFNKKCKFFSNSD